MRQGRAFPPGGLLPATSAALRITPALLVVAVLGGCGVEATRPTDGTAASAGAARKALSVRHDQPDAAEASYRARRRPLDPSIDPLEAYETAHVQLRRMPRHSLVLSTVTEPFVVDADLATAARTKLPTWEFLGPGNIGGRMRGFVIDPEDPDVIYACGVSGGVWKTTDGGASWSTATDQLANITFNSLVMDPADPAVLYGGTGEGYFREDVRGTGLPLRGAGIYVTRDAGATWTRLPGTESEDFYWVNDLVISHLDPSRIYAATRTGVWRSLDAGLHWIRVLATTVRGGCLDLALRSDTPGDFLFASCGTLDQASIYRATAAEGADTWEPVLSEPGMGRTSLAIAPSDQRVVYALAASNVPSGRNPYDQGLYAVFRSAAGGAAGSWTAQVRASQTTIVNSLLLTNPIAANSVRCSWDVRNFWVNMGWYCNVIAVDPADPDIVWAAGVDLFRSDDAGLNWGLASYWWTFPYQASFVHADQHNIVFHPEYDGVSNQTMYAACDGGIYRTDDARSQIGLGVQDVCQPLHSWLHFTSLNHGLGVTQFYHGAVFPGATRYLGGTQDNGTILGDDAAGTEGWRMIYGGDGGYSAIDPDDPDVIYVQSQGFDLEKSTDGGQTFVPSRAGVSPSEVFLFITPLSMDPNEPLRLWTGGLRLWRSDDGANSWNQASTVLDGTSRVSAVAVAPGRSDRVVIGTDSGRVAVSDAALSADQWTTWSSSRPSEGFVTSVAFDPSDVDVVYATYGGFGGPHLYRSGDGGRTFSSLGTGGPSPIPDVPAHCVLVDPASSRRLFLATDIGVLVSEDDGRSWAVENTGFASVVTEHLTLASGDDGTPYLFAFTHGRGAWRVRLPAAAAPPSPRRPGGRLPRP